MENCPFKYCEECNANDGFCVDGCGYCADFYRPEVADNMDGKRAYEETRHMLKKPIEFTKEGYGSRAYFLKYIKDGAHTVMGLQEPTKKGWYFCNEVLKTLLMEGLVRNESQKKFPNFVVTDWGRQEAERYEHSYPSINPVKKVDSISDKPGEAIIFDKKTIQVPPSPKFLSPLSPTFEPIIIHDKDIDENPIDLDKALDFGLYDKSEDLEDQLEEHFVENAKKNEVEFTPINQQNQSLPDLTDDKYWQAFTEIAYKKYGALITFKDIREHLENATI